MKKKIIIGLIILLIVLASICGYISYNNYQNRTISVITLDINPSIEIKLKKGNKIKSIKALNDDAKNIVKDIKTTSLDKALEEITENVVKEGYVRDRAVIIVYSTGDVNKKELKNNINEKFIKQNIPAEIIEVKSVSKEDEKLAKKYGVSAAKVAYIKEIEKDNKDIKIENLISKSVEEIKEVKVTGNYCDSDYNLEGTMCFKKIGEAKPQGGLVCPEGYAEYNDKCYKETHGKDTDELRCDEDSQLRDGKCYRTFEIEVITEYYCEKGELGRKGDYHVIGAPDNDKVYCIDKSTGVKPTQRCLLNPGHIMINGECYNGPAPTINGGCPNGDTLRNGWCYSKDDGDQWQCPNGSIYEKSKDTFEDLCPDTFTYYEPKVKGYKCEDGYKLQDNKCIKEEIMMPFNVKECEEGYQELDGRCLNLNEMADKVSGYVCEYEDSRLENNTCILFEVKDAYHN